MSEVRALIEQLIAAGVDPVDAAEVITRAAIVGAQAAADKKSAGAARQERYRNRHKASQSVTVTESDADPLSLDKETLPQTPTQETNPKTPPIAPPSRQRFADPVIVLQSVLDGLTSRRWVDHLAQKRKPMSAPSAEGMVEELREIAAQGGSPVEAVNLAIAKNWNSVSVEYCRNAGMKFSHSAPAKQVDWAGRLRAYRQGELEWPQGWGPKPGEPGCRAPPELLSSEQAA